MSTHIALELPEDAFSALKEDPENFAKELRLAAAVKWYEIGRISQEKAAEIAGLSRQEFIEALYRFKVSSVQYEKEEVEKEILGE
jgi:predicted HTH domain antitoxin